MAIAALVLLLIKAGQIGALIAVIRAAPLRIAGIGVGVAAYQALYFVGVAWGGVAVATAVALGVAPVAIVIYSCSVPSCSPAGGDESTRVPAAVAGVEIVDGVARFSVGRCSRRTGNAVFIVPWSCSYRLPLG
jgi:DME family drug/metabolite transporter